MRGAGLSLLVLAAVAVRRIRRARRGRAVSTGLRPQAPLQRRPNETPQAFAARIDRHMRTCVGCHHTYRSVSEADECEHKHEQAALELKRLRDRQRTRPVR